MRFEERLKALRTGSGMTQAELARRLLVSVTTIRNWEAGNKQPSMSAIIGLASVLDIGTDELLGTDKKAPCGINGPLNAAEAKLLHGYRSLDRHGKAIVETVCAMEAARSEAGREGKILHIDEVRRNPSRYIPKYLNPPAAGSSVPLDGTDFEMLPVADDTPPEADYAVEIHGQSMEPYIYDGETVYVKSCEELRRGDVGIFSVNGAMVCKQYCPQADGTILLASANPALRHTNLTISQDNGASLAIQGKVLLGLRVPMPDYLFDDLN